MWHAEAQGVDAIAAIPPIYFHLPDYSIADYWNTISAAAPNTDFIIYNIPQLAGGLNMGADAGIGGTYAVMKEILKRNGMELGSVRSPLSGIIAEDIPEIEKCRTLIDEAICSIIK